MAAFCPKCASPIDEQSGLCPNCNKESFTVSSDNIMFCPVCGDYVDPSVGVCPVCGYVYKQTYRAGSESGMGADIQIKSPSGFEGGSNGGFQDKALKESSAGNGRLASKHKKNPRSQKSGPLYVFITVLLSVCLFITALAATVILDVRNAFKEGNIERLFDSVEPVDIFEEFEPSLRYNADNFYSYLYNEYGIVMTDEKLVSIIDKSTARSFLSEKLSDYAGNFFDENAELKITQDEVDSLIRQNRALIETELGSSLSNDDIGRISNWIIDGDEAVIIRTEALERDYPDILSAARLCTSRVTLGIFFLLSALIIFFMIRLGAVKALCGIAVDCIVIGVITSVFSLLCYIASLAMRSSGSITAFSVAGNIASLNIKISISLLVIGTVLLVIRYYVKKSLREKELRMNQADF